MGPIINTCVYIDVYLSFGLLIDVITYLKHDFSDFEVKKVLTLVYSKHTEL